MPKNIVVCCDGTDNEVATDSTNVLRLYRMLDAAIGLHVRENDHRITGVSSCFHSRGGET
jgi:uncharacterized protein (DUF2235 family)